MGRLRGVLWLVAGLIVAGLAGVVAFVALSRATTAQEDGTSAASGPGVPVVVAARAVGVRAILAPEDLEVREIPVASVPEGALRETSQAAGQITLVDLYPGEVLLSQRLADPNVVTGDGRLALVLSEDQVLMAFPADDLMSRVGVLQPGDHVDLLFSLEVPVGSGLPAGEEEEAPEDVLVAFSVLQNVTLAAIVGGGPVGEQPDAILLTISPQDALVLKYLSDAGATMDIVLRAPGAEQPFVTEPVDVDWLVNRYRLGAGMLR